MGHCVGGCKRLQLGPILYIRKKINLQCHKTELLWKLLFVILASAVVKGTLKYKNKLAYINRLQYGEHKYTCHSSSGCLIMEKMSNTMEAGITTPMHFSAPQLV